MSERMDVVTGRKYTTSQGAEKTAWTRIGTFFLKDDGRMSIKLDALPLPNEKGEVWLSIFEQRDKEESAPAQQQGSGPRKSRPIDDDIPFMMER